MPDCKFLLSECVVTALVGAGKSLKMVSVDVFNGDFSLMMAHCWMARQ